MGHKHPHLPTKAELQALLEKRKGEYERRQARYAGLTALNKKQRRRLRAARNRYARAIHDHRMFDRDLSRVGAALRAHLRESGVMRVICPPQEVSATQRVLHQTGVANKVILTSVLRLAPMTLQEYAKTLKPF